MFPWVGVAVNSYNSDILVVVLRFLFWVFKGGKFSVIIHHINSLRSKRFQSIHFFFAPVLSQLSRRTSRGNACYVGYHINFNWVPEHNSGTVTWPVRRPRKVLKWIFHRRKSNHTNRVRILNPGFSGHAHVIPFSDHMVYNNSSLVLDKILHSQWRGQTTSRTAE